MHRVAAMVTSQQGKIVVHYLGGVHRFDNRPHGSKTIPICIRSNTAFAQDFTDDQHQEMNHFVNDAMKKMYYNALAIPPNLYTKGTTDFLEGTQLDLEYYFNQ